MGDSGFEPLASSASRKYGTLQEVSRACKFPANRHILQVTLFSRFQDISVGCCTPILPILRAGRNHPWDLEGSCSYQGCRRKTTAVPNERNTLELQEEMARLRDQLKLAGEQERATRERQICELTPETEAVHEGRLEEMNRLLEAYHLIGQELNQRTEA